MKELIKEVWPYFAVGLVGVVVMWVGTAYLFRYVLEGVCS